MIDRDFIRLKAGERKVKWSRHALGKVANEAFTVEDVEQALRKSVIIEAYPHLHRPLPDCLVIISISDSPIHCVIALDYAQDYILIVTVYRPTEEVWQDDWRTRR